MTEVPAVIQRLHSRYEKLVLKQHKWEVHRTLVIVIKGFHRVVICFADSERIVAHRFRERQMETTAEVIFAGDDPELFRRLVEYVECEVLEIEWKQWPPVEPVDAETQQEVTEILRKLEDDECCT